MPECTVITVNSCLQPHQVVLHSPLRVMEESKAQGSNITFQQAFVLCSWLLGVLNVLLPPPQLQLHVWSNIRLHQWLYPSWAAVELLSWDDRWTGIMLSSRLQWLATRPRNRPPKPQHVLQPHVYRNIEDGSKDSRERRVRSSSTELWLWPETWSTGWFNNYHSWQNAECYCLLDENHCLEGF